MSKVLAALVATSAILIAAPVQARMEKIAVEGPSLKGNLEGNAASRDVFVMLPPSYDAKAARKKRYPVLYFLHGFNASAQSYVDWIKFDEALQAFATKNEFIVVVPDTKTRMGGSFYASGPTVGDFETFIARDLVAAIDGTYRTLARRESRGLAGHSMGGYGTWRIGMKHPEVFSSLYAMSSCCLVARRSAPEDTKFEGMSLDAATKADFFTLAYFATAVAFSPAPDKPPFYADMMTNSGKFDPLVEARWAANAPTAMLPSYVPALKRMEAIAMDVGDKDFLLEDNKTLTRELNRFGIAHSYTLYEGDHGNRVAPRFREAVLPFFAAHLDGRR